MTPDAILDENTRRVLGLRLRPLTMLAPPSFGPEQRIVQAAPWIEFPANGQYFDVPGVIPTPALGATGTVISFTVPPGYDGVIRRLSHNYTGGGFVEGSGDLTWGVRVANAFVRNYNALTSQFGSPQIPRDSFILVKEGQLVEYLVTVAAGAAIPIAGTFIVCFMAGWFYPRGLV